MCSNRRARTIAKSLFNSIDVERTGRITKDEMKQYTIHVMSNLVPGYQFDEEHFERGFKILDPDQDGELN